MRKTAIIIISTLVAIGLAWAYIKSEVHTGVASKRQEDALAVSDANVGIGKEAKNQGEQATARADKSKHERAEQITQLKDKLHEKAESYDSIPLSPSDIDVLCAAYRSTDPVCKPTVKSD